MYQKLYSLETRKHMAPKYSYALKDLIDYYEIVCTNTESVTSLTSFPHSFTNSIHNQPNNYRDFLQYFKKLLSSSDSEKPLTKHRAASSMQAPDITKISFFSSNPKRLKVSTPNEVLYKYPLSSIKHPYRFSSSPKVHSYNTHRKIKSVILPNQILKQLIKRVSSLIDYIGIFKPKISVELPISTLYSNKRSKIKTEAGKKVGTGKPTALFEKLGFNSPLKEASVYNLTPTYYVNNRSYNCGY